MKKGRRKLRIFFWSFLLNVDLYNVWSKKGSLQFKVKNVANKSQLLLSSSRGIFIRFANYTTIRVCSPKAELSKSILSPPSLLSDEQQIHGLTSNAKLYLQKRDPFFPFLLWQGTGHALYSSLPRTVCLASPFLLLCDVRMSHEFHNPPPSVY